MDAIPNKGLRNQEEQDERDKVAKAIKDLRKDEYRYKYSVEPLYETSRSAEVYEKLLVGLRETFKYASEELESNVVLDIGAGTTFAAHQLSEVYEYLGLEFKATTLTNNTRGKPIYIGEDNRHITSAEVLRGIPDESVAVALSVFSLVYSKSPKMSVESINRVLVPGGVFKGFFLAESIYNSCSVTAEDFIRELKVHDFDTYAVRHLIDGGVIIIEAVKPSGDGTTMQRAADLFYGDSLAEVGVARAQKYIAQEYDIDTNINN